MSSSDRFLDEAPERGPNDDELMEAEQIRTLMRDLLRRGHTQRQLANEVGTPQSVLSQWLQGKWQAAWNTQHYKLRMWQQHRLEGQTLAPNEPVWVDTTTGQEIRNALTFAQLEPSISIVYGAAGVGKTTAIRRYQSEGRNVWSVTGSPTKRALEPALLAVAAALGLRGLNGGADQLSRDIAGRMYGSRGLLIFDEAQHLFEPALEELRSIHDACGVGVCLAGNEQVYSNLTGGGHRGAAFAQLFSRVGLRLHLPAPTREDVDAVIDAWGVKGHQELQFLRMLGEAEGGLRLLNQVLRSASREAEASGAAVTIDLLRAASRGVGARL